MELICYAGRGGEFCIGKLTKEQADFVFENGENEEYDLDGFWENNEIMANKPWYDFDEIARHNAAQLKNVLLVQKGVKRKCSKSPLTTPLQDLKLI